MEKILTRLLIVICLSANCLSYDLIFNSDKDVGQWKFNGTYLYGQKIESLGLALPNSAVDAVLQEDVPRQGYWLVRYNGPNADNFLRLGYALHHHLFMQALIAFIGTPNVPVTLSANGEEIGKFYSNGRQWCDAIITVDMKKEVFIDVHTPNPGDYILIDRIVLGVMSNLTQLTERRINPCSTSPPTGPIREEDKAPDMAYKNIPSRRRYEDPTPPPPPDMADKPVSSRQTQNVRPSPPDMSDKTRRDPQLPTNTVTTDANNNHDASEVKCGCSCSCSRVKNNKSPMTNMTG